MKIEDQYADILQNIEASIVAVYKDEPNLLDLDVLDALDALIRVYGWEREARGTPTLRLSQRAQHVYDMTRNTCEWILGRESLRPSIIERIQFKSGEKTISEILLCLKKIRSSVHFWNKENGRQGYLTYIRLFLNNSG